MNRARPLLIAALALPGLMLAACGEPPVRITSERSSDGPRGVLRVVEALQCPQTEGVLTRKGTAQAGGTICTYAGPNGAEVTLHLVALDGQTPEAALKRFEDELTASLPQAAARIRASRSEAEGSADRAEVVAPGVAVKTDGDRASVKLPGLRIDTDGQNASVNIAGFSIKADDSRGSVDISSGGDTVEVQAQDDVAQVRTAAAGQATRVTWILSDETPDAEGWRMAAYEARGPIGGPIVVATVRVKQRSNDPVMRAARALVTLNVGD